jgi:hypothetical protein
MLITKNYSRCAYDGALSTTQRRSGKAFTMWLRITNCSLNRNSSNLQRQCVSCSKYRSDTWGNWGKAQAASPSGLQWSGGLKQISACISNQTMDTERQSRNAMPVPPTHPSSTTNAPKTTVPPSPAKTSPKAIPTGPRKRKTIEAADPVETDDPIPSPTRRSSRAASKRPKVRASSPLRNHKPSSHPIQTISGIVTDPKDIAGKTLKTFKGSVHPFLHLFLFLPCTNFSISVRPLPLDPKVPTPCTITAYAEKCTNCVAAEKGCYWNNVSCAGRSIAHRGKNKTSGAFLLLFLLFPLLITSLILS